MRTKHLLIVCATALAAVLIVSAMASATVAVTMGKPNWWRDSEKTTDQIALSAFGAVKAPVEEMKAGGWLERKNLRERNIRFSKASKIGYLYIMSFGKFVGYYVVKGKVSSVNSQMTNTHQTWHNGSDDTVVDSVGDDGSFGPNEGGDEGIFFFTSTGILVETTLEWLYSDKPLAIANVPQLLK